MEGCSDGDWRGLIASSQGCFSPARALWEQRSVLERLKPRIRFFHECANDPTSLSLFQMAQWMATALSYKPDLIVEVGRAYGNSTCIFTEVANELQLGANRVLSYDINDVWDRATVPRLLAKLPESWFAPLIAVKDDIRNVDFHSELAGGRRVLVLWDAHGFEVAECILGAILPELAGREHLVLMHDMCDSRYLPQGNFNYGDNGLWKGTDFTGPRLKVGNIESAVDEAIALVDFATRNQLPLHSADHSLHLELGTDTSRCAELEGQLEELFSLEGYWFYFSLREAPGRLTFPKIKRALPQTRAIPSG
jgi:hypothetical protein